MKINLKTLIAIIAVIIIGSGIFLFAVTRNSSSKKETSNTSSNSSTTNKSNPENISGSTNSNGKFTLYPNSEDLVELTIGSYFQKTGRTELCKFKVPSNYKIENGLIRNIEDKETLNGTIKKLNSEEKLKSNDKLLCSFYLESPETPSYIEPTPNDTVIKLNIFTDAWKETENFKNAYSFKVNDLQAYALRDNTAKKDAVSLYIQFDENIILSLEYQTGPQISSTSIETIADELVKNITISYKNSAIEEMPNPSISNPDNTEKDNEALNYSTLFEDGGNKLSIQIKKSNDSRTFKLDLPENFEFDEFGSNENGTKLKKYINDHGNSYEGIAIKKDYTNFYTEISTTVTTNSENSLQRAQRRFPNGFSIGTDEHPAWAYEDNGNVWVFYQGEQTCVLSMEYSNSTLLNKYGANAIAKCLYDMISYYK